MGAGFVSVKSSHSRCRPCPRLKGLALRLWSGAFFGCLIALNGGNTAIVPECDLHRGLPQEGGEDSRELILADVKVSSLIDAEAKGKSIYNRQLPLRPAAEKHSEVQNVAALFPKPRLQPRGMGEQCLVTRLVGQLLSIRHSSSFPCCFSLFHIFSSVLAWLVTVLSPMVSVLTWFSWLEETRTKPCPLPSGSSGNASDFSLSGGEGVCV